MNELSTVLNPRAALERSTVHWTYRNSFSNGGGEAIATADNRKVLEAGVTQFISRLDPYRSPGIAAGPFQMPDGRWQATVRWFGLD
jgi:hypothetical protein